MKLRIGSRESALAVWQARAVMAAIHDCDPAIELELVTMKTTGDRILDKTLDKVGGKGLFVKELDRALLENRVDITVHSAKDLPMDLDPRLPLVAFSKRGDPRDALVLPIGEIGKTNLETIGCSSRRRAIQLAKLFPGVSVNPVRGNLQTRLKKLDQGGYSALVLAAAGLERLGLENRVSRYFSTEEMLPAAGQAILAVQAREGLKTPWLATFHDEDAADCIAAERAYVRELDGGCSSPVAAYATVEGSELTLIGMDETGGRATLSGPRTEGEKLGKALARQMKEGRT